MWCKVIGRKTYTSAALKSVTLTPNYFETALTETPSSALYPVQVQIPVTTVKKPVEKEVETVTNRPTTSTTSKRSSQETTRSIFANPNKIIPIVDLNNQTVEICKFEHIRRSTVVGSEPLWKYMHSDARTLVECFQRGARLSDNGPCLGYRKQMADGTQPYVWLTYNEVLYRSENFARGLIAKGIRPGQSSLVGVYSQNRPEFVITEQACYFFSMVIVPLYDTLGPDSCSFIINQTEMEVVVCDNERRAETIIQKRMCCPNLRFIVMMEEPSESLKRKADDSQIELITMADVESLGSFMRTKLPPLSPEFPSPDDLATICYTSGTTGNTKGAMLTHANVVAASTSAHMLRFTRTRCGDVMISFLPMAHMYERLLQTIFYTAGGSVGFSRGDIKLLPDDIKVLQPHVIPSVPRLLNRVYDKVMREVGQSVFKKWLLNLAVKAKTASLQNLVVRNDTLWDSIVFRKLQENMGGRLKLLLSGSAPISREVLHLLRAGMGALIVEGYGTTETGASGCSTVEGDISPDHVGIPSPCCEIKLIDVLEMNYFAKHGRGEVCIRGNNLIKGYYRDPANTAKAFDKFGWLRTGDIGMWTLQGTLRLTERKKNIFKLDQGEYIAPEKIENVYNRTQYVSQTYVHGDSMRSYLVAVVIPDPEVLHQAAERNLGIRGSFEELCQNEKVLKMIHDDMILEGHRAGLQSFEQAKRIVLDSEPFTVEQGLLTPTLKSKRISLREFYKNEIISMYKDVPDAVRSYSSAYE